MQLPAALNKYRNEIEADLRAVVSLQRSPLSPMMEYQLGWCDEGGVPIEAGMGKRVRPVLCLLSCQLAGGDYQEALPAASAVELLHNFSLIHDDIQDGSPKRHSRPTVWWVWGPAQAINAGDGMHAVARLALMRLVSKGVPHAMVVSALRKLDEACLRLCEGQYLDINYMERLDITVDAYLKMVEGKTGALMGCTAELGAMVATDDAKTWDAMKTAGRKLGIAFQIRDDILDLWGSQETGKAPAGDVLNKKKSLPVAYAMEKATGQQKRMLGNIYFQRVLQPGDVPKVIEVLEVMGAREFSQRMAVQLRDEAMEIARSVASAPSTALDELGQLADFMICREA